MYDKKYKKKYIRLKNSIIKNNFKGGYWYDFLYKNEKEKILKLKTENEWLKTENEWLKTEIKKNLVFDIGISQLYIF